jgi:hypothetical protein
VKTSKIGLFLIATVLFCGHAFATKVTLPETPKPAEVKATATAGAQAGAASDASATATNTANQSVSADTSASNELAFNTNIERSAPSIGQGGLLIGDCGAGANAGGSNTGGAGFLGIVWTPKDCKLLLAAQAFHALGMHDEACRMVTGLSVVKARFKELGLLAPTCALAKPSEPAAASLLSDSAYILPDTSQFMTRDEYQADQKERGKRMLETLTSK